jgi:hypothetical protein
MAQLNYQRFIRLHEEKGAARAKEEVADLFRAKQIRPQEIDLGRLFAECFGYRTFCECRRHPGEQGYGVSDVMRQALTEAAGATTTAAFLNIGGQFMYQTVLDGYQSEELVFSPLIPEAQASTLDGEKIPGITEVGDEAAFRDEGDPYALAGVGENWIFTPTIRDQGMILPATWEAFFNDKTGQLAERLNGAGKWMGVRREKAAIDCVVDENVTTHRYNWRGNVIASYNDNTGTHTWDNLAASNALVDWTDVDAAEQVLNAITDPFTGEPILIEPKHLIVTKQLEQTARRVLSATEIRVATPGYATSGNPTQTNQANPYLNKYEVKTSRLLASRMATDTSWFLIDAGKYAKCMIAEKFGVQQAPPNSHDEFTRRIVTQVRVNERFAYVVVEPRVGVKNTA